MEQTYEEKETPSQYLHMTRHADGKMLPISSEKEVRTSPSPSTDPIGANASPSSSNLTGPTFNLAHSPSFPWRNVLVSGSNGTPTYYAEISEATPGKPDILLHQRDKSGSIVARTYFRLNRNTVTGLGPSDLESTWIVLKRSAFYSIGAFTFSHEGRGFRIERTHSADHGVEGVKKAGMGSFRVMEKCEGGDKVVAVYVEAMLHPAWMKGSLRFAGGVREEFVVLVVMGVVGWREKMRRRAAYAPQVGGGG